MLYSIVVVLVLVLDQAVKFYTVRSIPPQAIGDACKTLIPGVIHMTNVQNYGAAFSILENARTALIVVSILFVIGIIILINMDIIHTKFGRWTAVLVMAGALGNCIDRILLGYVVDMFEFELFNFAVFNVADIFITVCGILFCIHVIVYREPEEERNAVPRPEKKRGRLSAARPEPEDEDQEEAYAPRRSAKARQDAGRRSRQAPEENQDVPPARARRERKERTPRRLPADDMPPLDPNDPFAEWSGESAPAVRPERPAKPARRTREETPAPQPARRRTAPALEDEDDFELDMPAPRAPARSKAAPAASVQEPAAPVSEPDDAGFDEYSLDDILAEFRDD